jgi:hypothetical protein
MNSSKRVAHDSRRMPAGLALHGGGHWGGDVGFNLRCCLGEIVLWSDERYVRMYTRDTIDWVAWGWESQALFMLVLRKVDRGGLLPLGKHGIRGLAGLLAMPTDVIERAIEPLMLDGCVEIRESTLVVRNFIEAQEATISDAQRQREHRARSRDVARAKELLGSTAFVTNRDTCVTKRNENVTHGHGASQPVTPSLAVPPVPSRAVPLDAPPEKDPDVAPVARRKRGSVGQKKEPNPRHGPLMKRLKAVFFEIRGAEYNSDGADSSAVTRLCGRTDNDDEIVRRWRRALTTRGHPGTSSLVQFNARWNELAGQQASLLDLSRGVARADDSIWTDDEVNRFNTGGAA